MVWHLIPFDGTKICFTSTKNVIDPIYVAEAQARDSTPLELQEQSFQS